MSFDKIRYLPTRASVHIGKIDPCREKMCDKEALLAASAATIGILSAALVLHQKMEKKNKKIPASSSESARPQEIHSATHFTRDSILGDENLLRLEYRSGAGFRNFFRISQLLLLLLFLLLQKKWPKLKLDNIRSFSTISSSLYQLPTQKFFSDISLRDTITFFDVCRTFFLIAIISPKIRKLDAKIHRRSLRTCSTSIDVRPHCSLSIDVLRQDRQNVHRLDMSVDKKRSRETCRRGRRRPCQRDMSMYMSTTARTRLYKTHESGFRQFTRLSFFFFFQGKS